MYTVMARRKSLKMNWTSPHSSEKRPVGSLLPQPIHCPESRFLIAPTGRHFLLQKEKFCFLLSPLVQFLLQLWPGLIMVRAGPPLLADGWDVGRAPLHAYPLGMALWHPSQALPAHSLSVCIGHVSLCDSKASSREIRCDFGGVWGGKCSQRMLALLPRGPEGSSSSPCLTWASLPLGGARDKCLNSGMWRWW